MKAATTTSTTTAEVFASAVEKAAEMSEYLASTEALGRRARFQSSLPNK